MMIQSFIYCICGQKKNHAKYLTLIFQYAGQLYETDPSEPPC